MALYKAGSSSKLVAHSQTEFDILKASHKFLRDDGDERVKSSWNDELAKKYYANLYREYAVCDLKHYKSGNFALRWRTEAEVISGAGETTCGNTRCGLYDAPRAPGLKTLELPFAYVEDGANKFALVKVVLCERCCRKLLWKRTKEKEKEREAEQLRAQPGGGDQQDGTRVQQADAEGEEGEGDVHSRSARRGGSRGRRTREDGRRQRHEASRSRSPSRRKEGRRARKRSPLRAPPAP